MQVSGSVQGLPSLHGSPAVGVLSQRRPAAVARHESAVQGSRSSHSSSAWQENRQSLSHPSLPTTLPSSHSSPGSTEPSPQSAALRTQVNPTAWKPAMHSQCGPPSATRQ